MVLINAQITPFTRSKNIRKYPIAILSFLPAETEASSVGPGLRQFELSRDVLNNLASETEVGMDGNATAFLFSEIIEKVEEILTE